MLISGENRYDVYKHYLENLFGQSVGAKNTYFREGCIWIEDTSGAMNDMDPNGNNKGYLARFGIFNGGSEVHVRAKIPYPLAQANLLLNPGIDLKFIFKKASSKFTVINNCPEKNMELNIKKMWITCTAHAIEPPMYNSLVNTLQKEDSSKLMIRDLFQKHRV